MKFNQIQITALPPQKSLIGFASCVVDGWLQLNNIAIHTRKSGGFRLTFPARTILGKYGEERLLFFWRILTSEAERELTKAITFEIERIGLFKA